MFVADQLRSYVMASSVLDNGSLMRRFLHWHNLTPQNKTVWFSVDAHAAYQRRIDSSGFASILGAKSIVFSSFLSDLCLVHGLISKKVYSSWNFSTLGRFVCTLKPWWGDPSSRRNPLVHLTEISILFNNYFRLSSTIYLIINFRNFEEWLTPTW